MEEADRVDRETAQKHRIFIRFYWVQAVKGDPSNTFQVLEEGVIADIDQLILRLATQVPPVETVHAVVARATVHCAACGTRREVCYLLGADIRSPFSCSVEELRERLAIETTYVCIYGEPTGDAARILAGIRGAAGV